MTAHERLLVVKKAVQKATQEAFRPEPDDPNASFHLGMELFGQEVTEVERNVQEKLTGLEKELKETLNLVATQSDDPMEMAREAQMLRAKITFLKLCSEARALLDESITLSKPSLAPQEETDLVQAARLLVQAQAALQKCYNMVAEQAKSNPQSPTVIAAKKILESIKHSIRQQKLEIIGHVKDLWHATVALAPYSLSVQSSHNGIQVVFDTLKALNEQQSLDELLRNFTRKLYEDVIGPIIQSHKDSERGPKIGWTFQESETRGSISSVKCAAVTSNLSKGPYRVLEWSREEDIMGNQMDGYSIAAWKDTFEFMGKIVSFISNNIIAGQPDEVKWFRDRFFGRPKIMLSQTDLEEYGFANTRFGDDDGLIIEPLVEALLETCVPDSLGPDEIKELTEMSEELRSFVQPFLTLLSESDLIDPTSRLDHFLTNYEKTYIDRRRSMILHKARLLLRDSDYHNTRLFGDERKIDKERQEFGLDDGLDIFYLQKAAVSETVLNLIEICRETMEEAVSMPYFPLSSPLNSLSATLFKTARDVLDLFRAMIPVRFDSEIKSVPRTAAIFHNDNVFLAYSCLTLGKEYKDRFPEAQPDDKHATLLRKYCMFVDMAPLFREHADKPFRHMLSRQAEQIHELVQPRINILGQSLRSRESLSEWSDAETAVEAASYHLKHLKQAWKPVLSKNIYSKAMGYLIDEFARLFLDQVIGATAISPAACSFIGMMIGKAARTCEDILEKDTSHSKNIDRFEVVGKIVNMTMMEFERALSDGTFRSMSNEDLSHLLRSVFEDSPKRKEILGLLNS